MTVLNKVLKKLTGINSGNKLDTAIASALTEVSAAVMMVDRDFIVTYVNNATVQLFDKHAEVFKKAFPTFNPQEIIGTNIDVFHRNPAHQRQLLADPSRLPFVTDIKLGDLIVNLYVTGTYDAEGNYTGNVLEWRDVTEDRQRAQKDLDNAGKLDAIDRVQGVVEYDLNATVIEVNENFLSIVGYDKTEVIGKQHSVFVEAADAKTTDYANLWQQLKNGQSQSGRFKRLSKSGEQLWIEASYNPVFDTKGDVYKVVEYASDVTEQVNLEMKSKTLSLVADETDNSVLITDGNGLIEYVNQGFETLTGYTFEEVKGKKPGSFLQGKLTDKDTVQRVSKKLKAGEAFYEEILNYDKSGNSYWISLAINPVKNPQGQVEKFVSIQTNINETKVKTLEFLARLDAISEVSAIIEFTPEGIITDANDNFTNTVGYSLDEIKGKHHRMFVAPDEQNSASYAQFWENLKSGQPDTGQFRRFSKDGQEIWLEASYNPIFDQDGKVNKVVKFATNITEQHKMQAALKDAVAESNDVIELAKSGDLTGRVDVSGKTGEIASLCGGINALIDNMAEVLTTIREAGETINTAADEIATGNNDLSQRTEEQASNLEQTASSMEELASTVKQNAENAKQANQLASAASGVAVKGGDVVGQVVTTMGAINESAQKIEDIITVIDGIAFQTNILALNAAVEAARAGEQGRGFAVVAGEVRNLAQRSASAAKEIKDLITDSVTKTAEGTTLVENAGTTMQEIVESVQRVTDIMGEISAASDEQSTGIDQVNGAITNMDEVTQQNAALVEEAAAAAESLVEQAVGLMTTVDQFKVSNHAQKTERRASNSPMRNQPPLAPKVAPKKATAKTGTDDASWEEF